MNTVYKISILILLIGISCKPKSEKQAMKKISETSIQINPEIKKVGEALKQTNDWFKLRKKEWMRNDLGDSLNIDYDDPKWFGIINSWVNSSDFFSKKYVAKQGKMNSEKFDHFGLMFFDYKLGQMLHSLCDPEELNTHIVKEGDNRYRYTSPFYKVLNDVPIPDQSEGFLWLWDEGENGEVWRFSIILIKENDKWVIDEIDRYFGVPVEKK